MVNDVRHILGMNCVIISSFFLQLIGKLSIKSNPHSLARSKTTDHHFVEALYMKFLFRFSFYLTCLFVFKDFHFYYNSAISNCKNHSNAVCSQHVLKFCTYQLCRYKYVHVLALMGTAKSHSVVSFRPKGIMGTL